MHLNQNTKHLRIGTVSLGYTWCFQPKSFESVISSWWLCLNSKSRLGFFFPTKISDQKSQIERKDSISPSFGTSASVAWCNKSSCKSKRCITAAWCFLVVSGSVANSERSARVVRWRCDFTRFLRHMQPPNLRGGFSNQKIPCNIQPKKIFVPPCTEL